MKNEITKIIGGNLTPMEVPVTITHTWSGSWAVIESEAFKTLLCLTVQYDNIGMNMSISRKIYIDRDTDELEIQRLADTLGKFCQREINDNYARD